jgi:hypothetical protein
VGKKLTWSGCLYRKSSIDRGTKGRRRRRRRSDFWRDMVGGGTRSRMKILFLSWSRTRTSRKLLRIGILERRFYESLSVTNDGNGDGSSTSNLFSSAWRTRRPSNNCCSESELRRKEPRLAKDQRSPAMRGRIFHRRRSSVGMSSYEHIKRMT